MRFSSTISRYLIGAILPYFLFSWLLLSVILFVQQASRFYDVFFNINLPSNLVWQLAIALLPNVIAFTCPMAALVGVVIGLSKMQGDSELVAIRAAGVGNLQISVPVAVLGIVLSVFAFLVNLFGVPLAAGIVRRVATQTAIYKLESPIEPGVFNTEVSGYTIYVKDGDLAEGSWKNIFIHTEDDKSGTVRLITSRRGRIDSTDQLSELVLEDAVSTTITPDGATEKFISEKIGEFRFAIKTRRGELIEKLANAEASVEELGLAQLSQFARSKEGKERTEAEIIWARRIILSITPLIFCLLGTALVLRFNRAGRGFAIVLSLASLITFYLLAFLGEQLSRTGKLSVFEGSLMPLVVSFAAIVWFNFSGKLNLFGRLGPRIREYWERSVADKHRVSRKNLFVDLTTGLRDFDIAWNLIRYYLLTLAFLSSIFIIFTAFELWRFAGTIDGGVWLLTRYLFFLLPFMYLQLAPSAAMIATLATYVIKSRQNEIVTWTSAGQSVYRLLFPCFVLMLILGGVNLFVQELLAPRANLLQDQLRVQIRNRGVSADKSSRYWVANDRRIYSFSLDAIASDNEKRVSDLTAYEFANNGELQALYRTKTAIWDRDRLRLPESVKKSTLNQGKVENFTTSGIDLPENSNPFVEVRKKPSQMSIGDTRVQIKNSESEVEERSFEVALEKKYSTFFLPFVIALFTAPFALSLSRKGKAVTVGYAVGLWLIFMGLTAVFEQFGLTGFLPASAAVWGPLFVFAMLGIYLLSRVKT